ncbi:MAG: hypothetical protein JO320_19965 [Alphaproteobacteria bacterium]|nr:hypothetical protein [Alphaproteobacteria bacterium]MBV9377296.1 hypothetical protein [Alphaproteobacteria bacterium]
MKRAFHLFNDFCDIVERNPRFHLTEVPRRNLEGLAAGRAALACQPTTQRLIYDLSERAPGAA